VRAGLPPELLDSALDALAALKDPQAAELLAQLSQHRRPSVRVRAVRALGALKRPETEAALARALRDLDPDVRQAAAEAFGELPNTAHFDVLFTAFERGVSGAGRAVGKQASEAQIGQVLGALGRVPLTSLTPVFDALLARRDLSEAAKLRVITALTELGTAEARGYLEGLRQNLPNDAPIRVRRNIDEAVARMAK
jgi:HEAT repeat protein